MLLSFMLFDEIRLGYLGQGKSVLVQHKSTPLEESTYIVSASQTTTLQTGPVPYPKIADGQDGLKPSTKSELRLRSEPKTFWLTAHTFFHCKGFPLFVYTYKYPINIPMDTSLPWHVPCWLFPILGGKRLSLSWSFHSSFFNCSFNLTFKAQQ